jgi:hypothetical protein
MLLELGNVTFDWDYRLHMNNSSGAMVGEVLVLYVTVLVLAVCVCVMLAIVKRGIWDDRCYHPTYISIFFYLLFPYLL